jgi:hypothetical protein
LLFLNDKQKNNLAVSKECPFSSMPMIHTWMRTRKESLDPLDENINGSPSPG